MALKSRTIVATPAYRGDVVMQYAHSITRDAVLAILDGHFVEAPVFINDTYIHIARNRAVKEFLKQEFDYLVLIDADMGWEPGALGGLIGLPADLDVVGGVYRAKEDKPRYPVNLRPGVPLEFPLCEVAGVATGFMRISRNCIHKMMAKFPNGRLFDHIVDGRNIEWGDDMAFCIRARQAGCRVWGKFDIEFEHVGPYAWKGVAQEQMAPFRGKLLPPDAPVDPAPPFAGTVNDLTIADLPKPVRAFA